MRRLLLAAGILAPVVYLAAVVLGGAITPGYSHVEDHVSALVRTGAPHKDVLDPMFLAYNLLTLAFAVGFLMQVRGRAGHKRRTIGTLAALSLAVAAAAGLATVFYPEGVEGDPTSGTGSMHVVLVSINSPATIIAMALAGVWLSAARTSTGPARFSYLMAGVVVASGVASVLGIHTSFAGLLERITIGGFVVWLFVIAIEMCRAEGRLVQAASPAA
jgi:hypothetical protein